jgi:hypothetical protein
LSKVMSPMLMVLRVRVARWRIRPRKLCQICPSGLAWGRPWQWRAAGGGDGAGVKRRLLVGVGERGQGLAHMQGEVGREHADQHVSADPVLQPVVDRAQVQVVGFHGPKVAFDAGEVL